MHRLFLALLLLPMLCAAACSQALSPHTQFVRDNGGPAHNPFLAARAAAALARLRPGLRLGPDCTLRTTILHNSSYCAFSFTDGAIYLSSALVDRLTEDELAGVIAHEIGHMVHDRVVQLPRDASVHAALLGRPGINGQALEITADALGRQVLIEHHIPPESLPSALGKVDEPGASYYAHIQARIAILHALDR